MRENLAMIHAPLQRASSGLAGDFGAQVVGALIDEVTLAPKPGLVDIRSQGAHHDLDWKLMCKSALALQLTFVELDQAGIETRPLPELRERIGAIGRDGEARMMDATHGVNTHRGAIWALGLLVTAAAREPDDLAADAIAARAAEIARISDRHAPLQTGHKGEQARIECSVGGARGQSSRRDESADGRREHPRAVRHRQGAGIQGLHLRLRGMPARGCNRAGLSTDA